MSEKAYLRNYRNFFSEQENTNRNAYTVTGITFENIATIATRLVSKDDYMIAVAYTHSDSLTGDIQCMKIGPVTCEKSSDAEHLTYIADDRNFITMRLIDRGDCYDINDREVWRGQMMTPRQFPYIAGDAIYFGQSVSEIILSMVDHIDSFGGSSNSCKVAYTVKGFDGMDNFEPVPHTVYYYNYHKFPAGSIYHSQRYFDMNLKFHESSKCCNEILSMYHDEDDAIVRDAGEGDVFRYRTERDINPKVAEYIDNTIKESIDSYVANKVKPAITEITEKLCASLHRQNVITVANTANHLADSMHEITTSISNALDKYGITVDIIPFDADADTTSHTDDEWDDDDEW